MSYDIVSLHKMIDTWAAEQRAKEEGVKGEEHSITTESVAVKPERVLPEGQRVARTKTQGDKVYLLDDNNKTRSWVTSPEILAGLGFEMGDVVEVDDVEFLRYQMAPAIYKLPDGKP